MSEYNYQTTETAALSQNKIITLFSVVILICLTSIGFNIHHELTQSLHRIGIEIQMSKEDVLLTHVVKPGPSFRAGIKANSYIVSINNEPIHNFAQFDAALASEKSEANIVVRKNGVTTSYTVLKGMPPSLNYFFIYILVCALFLVLAFISIPSRGSQNTTRNLLLIFLFLLLGLEFILIPVRSLLNITEYWSHLAAITGTILAGIAGGLTFALVLHILCITPKPQPWFIKNKPLILTALYSVSVYFIFTLIFSYINTTSEGITGLLFSFFSWILIDILWIILIISVFLLQYFGTQSQRGKNQLLILFVGILPFIISMSLVDWNYLTGSDEPAWLESFEIFARFSFSIGFLIAIKRYDLADIGRDIQRPFVFKAISALIIFFLLNSLYDYFTKSESINQTNLFYFGIYSLLIGMMWFPLSRLLQYWAFAPWHSDAENFSPMLDNILDSIMAFSGNDRVAENLPRLLNASLQSNWIAISLSGNNGKPYFYCEQHTDKPLPEDLLKTELISLFYGLKNYSQNLDQSNGTSTLFELGATHVLPLIYRDEVLGGIVLAQSSEQYFFSNRALNEFSEKLAEIIFINKMKNLATIDGLTKILRREAIMEKLHSEFSRYQRSSKELSICLLDLDHFKQVNDSYGHATGDEALKLTATLLKDRIRNTDFIGRYGGEEFLLIFPKTEISEAKAFAESLRQAIQSTAISISQNISINITASMGITSTDILQNKTEETPNNQIQKLIGEADIALYLAKETGRNKVVIAPGTPSV